MSRTYVTVSLLLVLAGCSSNKAAEQSSPAASPIAQPAVTPTPAVTATPTPSPAPVAAKPDAKTASKVEKAQKKDKAKKYTGSPTDQLAQCLADKGAVMYGVFWCDHCRQQKELFGESFKYVKYVECVTPDAPRTLIPECKAQGISHTPTWIFSDGSRLEGSIPLATLADKAGCKAP